MHTETLYHIVYLMRGCRTFRTIELTLLFPAGHCAGLTDIVATGEVLGVAPGAVGLSARGTLVQIHYYKIVLAKMDPYEATGISDRIINSDC